MISPWELLDTQSGAVLTPALTPHLHLELLQSSLHPDALVAGAKRHEGGVVPVVGGQQGGDCLVVVSSQ